MEEDHRHHSNHISEREGYSNYNDSDNIDHQHQHPSSTSMFETEQHDVESQHQRIVDIEYIFLMKDYSKALTVCNEYLISYQKQRRQRRKLLSATKHSSTTQSSSTETLLENHVSIKFPFEFDHLQQQQQQQPNLIKQRYISVQLWNDVIFPTSTSNNSNGIDPCMEQVAVILLQSWYELLKQEQQLLWNTKQQQQEKQKQLTVDRFTVRSHHDLVNIRYQFLQPFIDTFTFTSTSIKNNTTDDIDYEFTNTMSLELFIVLIRLLSSSVVQYPYEAISLSAQYLRYLRSTRLSKDQLVPQQQQHQSLSPTNHNLYTYCNGVSEIMIYFFTELLPNHCYSTITCTSILDYIQQTTTTANIRHCTSNGINDIIEVHDNDLESALSSILTTMKNESIVLKQEHNFDMKRSESRKDIIQLCLCYCNTDDTNWINSVPNNNNNNNNSEVIFAQCRKILQQMLLDIYNNNRKNRTNQNFDISSNDVVSTITTSNHSNSTIIVRRTNNNFDDKNILSLLSNSFRSIITFIRTMIQQHQNESMSWSDIYRIILIEIQQQFRVLLSLPTKPDVDDSRLQIRMQHCRRRAVVAVVGSLSVTISIITILSWYYRYYLKRTRSMNSQITISDMNKKQRYNINNVVLSILQTTILKPIYEIIQAFQIQQ